MYLSISYEIYSRGSLEIFKMPISLCDSASFQRGSEVSDRCAAQLLTARALEHIQFTVEGLVLVQDPAYPASLQGHSLETDNITKLPKLPVEMVGFDTKLHQLPTVKPQMHH